ncbi:hypothetical protein PU683_10910 [Kosakonia cowanii]|uniref:hypothetical protein n=1 Tax=Kosakonia cowanii TaxID=208223 RepID=UPI0023F7D2C1|nr:hypothetical protein [Kosakonia cowanii]MDF7760039.1 hypothetical protein [Kosakonia cowanii]
MRNKALLVGFFNPLDEVADAGSPAGSKVQHQILNSLSKSYDEAEAFVLGEKRAWPYSDLIEKPRRFGNIYYPFIFNFKAIKFLVFSFLLLVHVISNNFRVVYQYNSFFFVNLTCLILRLFGRKNVLILQDIHCNASFFKSVKQGRFWEWLALQIAKLAYTQILPISEAIVEDFNFKKEGSLVWAGGIIGDVQSDYREGELAEYGVLACTLMPYNGAYDLCKAWVDQKISIPLHIFGDGTDKEKILNLAKINPFIIFHGKVPPEEVKHYTTTALLNFCLRYDRGINQRYFFPSKFFDIYTCRGYVVVNDFYGLTEKIKHNLFIVDDELTRLSSVVDHARQKNPREDYVSRINYAEKHLSWDRCINKIHQNLHNKD